MTRAKNRCGLCHGDQHEKGEPPRVDAARHGGQIDKLGSGRNWRFAVTALSLSLEQLFRTGHISNAMP
jgi:hypothetical protein